ncbi:MAG: hypothetical protein DDT30_00304 [Dehalococcoidia bacterium]|nr:hypothetical protein [Bacillota bacterium]
MPKIAKTNSEVSALKLIVTKLETDHSQRIVSPTIREKLIYTKFGILPKNPERMDYNTCLLFPLNSRRRLRCNVVDHAIHVRHLVNYPVRDTL